MNLKRREKILGCLALLSVVIMAILAVTEEDAPSGTKSGVTSIARNHIPPPPTVNYAGGVKRRPVAAPRRRVRGGGVDLSSLRLDLLGKRFSHQLSELRSDPFQEVSSDSSSLSGPLDSLVLDGIFEGSSHRSAIINGQVVREGDVLSNAQAEVLEIRSDSIVLVTCDEHIIPVTDGSARLTRDGSS